MTASSLLTDHCSSCRSRLGRPVQHSRVLPRSHRADLRSCGGSAHPGPHCPIGNGSRRCHRLSVTSPAAPELLSSPGPACLPEPSGHACRADQARTWLALCWAQYPQNLLTGAVQQQLRGAHSRQRGHLRDYLLMSVLLLTFTHTLDAQAATLADAATSQLPNQCESL